MLFIKVDRMNYSNNLNDITNQINLVRFSQKNSYNSKFMRNKKKKCFFFFIFTFGHNVSYTHFAIGWDLNWRICKESNTKKIYKNKTVRIAYGDGMQSTWYYPFKWNFTLTVNNL